MLLMIDNYDSFTYNLVQYLGELGADVEVYRNDEITVDEIKARKPEKLMISPGPCTPDEAGISMQAIKTFAGEIPILGVCLGHQSIGQVFGGKIIHAKEIMHGKTSKIYHKNTHVFKGLKNPYIATRYHSLVIEKESLPECLEITAWTETEAGDLMCFFFLVIVLTAVLLPLLLAAVFLLLLFATDLVEGVQFHPESILTEHGHDLLNNFLKYK